MGSSRMDLASGRAVRRMAVFSAPVRREVVRVDEAPGQVPTAVERRTQSARLYNAAMTRQEMAQSSEALGVFVSEVRTPVVSVKQEPDVEMVEL